MTVQDDSYIRSSLTRVLIICIIPLTLCGHTIYGCNNVFNRLLNYTMCDHFVYTWVVHLRKYAPFKVYSYFYICV